MMTTRGPVLALALVVVAGCGAAKPAEPPNDAVSPARSEAMERVVAAANVVRELRGTADAIVPRAVSEAARCVAVVPGLVHAGFILGARAGRGVATCREGRAWSRPSFFRITGASAGVQAGVQSVDVVMVMMTNASVTALVSGGKVQLGATTSVAAGPVGREAQASSDLTFSAEVLTYSRASGLFVGLDVSGTVLEPDEESSRAFYGDPRDFRALLRTPPEPPSVAKDLTDAVERAFPANGSAP
ncbi:MAG: YSC84-like protein 1 [Myxococcales bacterium]|nr:YSC84-like protein 1 [Myxococcales bacterium]